MLPSIRINLPTFRLLLTSFILAFCSLSYEFMIAQTISSLLGNTLLFYTLTIGLYIFSLGIGSLVPVEKLTDFKLKQRLYWVEIVICILGGWGPIWLILFDHVAFSVIADTTTVYLFSVIASLSLVVIIGVLSGMELPILLRIDQVQHHGKYYIQLLAFDYIASFVGALAFPLWFFREWGILKSANFFALFNLAVIFMFFPDHKKLRHLTVIMILFILLGYSFVQNESIHEWVSQRLLAAKP
ncbi:MAG: hypothetical protein ACOH5I_01040 [Oligoflexus sp.]